MRQICSCLAQNNNEHTSTPWEKPINRRRKTKRIFRTITKWLSPSLQAEFLFINEQWVTEVDDEAKYWSIEKYFRFYSLKSRLLIAWFIKSVIFEPHKFCVGTFIRIKRSRFATDYFLFLHCEIQVTLSVTPSKESLFDVTCRKL